MRNANCRYDSAERAYLQALELMEKLKTLKTAVNVASLHGEMCALRFAKSFYDEVTVKVHSMGTGSLILGMNGYKLSI